MRIPSGRVFVGRRFKSILPRSWIDSRCLVAANYCAFDCALFCNAVEHRPARAFSELVERGAPRSWSDLASKRQSLSFWRLLQGKKQGGQSARNSKESATGFDVTVGYYCGYVLSGMREAAELLALGDIC
jgi:hypothetical protein